MPEPAQPPATLDDLGWGEPFADAFAQLRRPDLVPARVVAAHRGIVGVASTHGERLAEPSGLLRRDGPPIAVGDWVALDVEGGIVHAVLPRRGALTRAQADREQVLAANIDVAFVVTSLNRELNLRRVERFLALATAGRAEPAIVLTKSDLVDDPGDALGALRPLADGAPVLVTSVNDGVGLEAISALLAGPRTGVLLGASGVGKSSLVNALLGTDRQSVAPIRASDDRGRHTTTRRELLVLPGGGLLVDTPGLKLPRMGAGAEVGTAFADIDALALECRFADCRHEGEPGCAVQAAVADGRLDPARLEALQKLEREEQSAAERSDDRARSEKRARDRTVHKALKAHYRDSPGGEQRGR